MADGLEIVDAEAEGKPFLLTVLLAPECEMRAISGEAGEFEIQRGVRRWRVQWSGVKSIQKVENRRVSHAYGKIEFTTGWTVEVSGQASSLKLRRC